MQFFLEYSISKQITYMLAVKRDLAYRVENDRVDIFWLAFYDHMIDFRARFFF